ncbi:hypothetical protein ABI_10140 [Asticcacaulis biprosthecium C19]|uniref:Uncharacterized protein n=1 Tax=Asticcacaulis biprosthecium C19 TaxID=715226 RepID=F4QH40_9CAUL|nr:hypothetical protein [Asticcacaulis biprosthecium]EGF92577.1 hypothetical protein ABI_10140 [Asticcacaulis biprosthecium C19]
MRYLAPLALVFSLFATAAIANEQSDLEEQTLSHLQASNAALDAASTAIDSGNVQGSCPHLRTASGELDAAYDTLGRYRQVVLSDTALTTSERDTQVGELTELQSQIQQQSDDIDALVAQHCT